MSFAERKITVIFTLAEDDFGEGNNQVTVENLRVEAQIDNYGGIKGSTLYAKIYGMKEPDMLKCCTYKQTFTAVKNIMVTVLAGDDLSGMSQVFQGTIHDGQIEYDDMPSIPLVIQARAGYIQQLMIAAPNSQSTMDVASMIESLAKSIGFKFVNNGVKTTLANHYSYGSPIEQIQDISRSANINLDISNNEIAISSLDLMRDDHVINVSPETGLIGYPSYLPSGQIINTIFQPDFLRLRKCRVKSSVERASGDFFIQGVSHLITSKIPGGPWMSTVELTSTPVKGA